LSLSKVVITGLDPVIHAFWRAAAAGGEGADGRIKSGHDDWRCFNIPRQPASIAPEIVNRTAEDLIRPSALRTLRFYTQPKITLARLDPAIYVFRGFADLGGQDVDARNKSGQRVFAGASNRASGLTHSRSPTQSLASP
jgi:hypothetical protein